MSMMLPKKVPKESPVAATDEIYNQLTTRGYINSQDRYGPNPYGPNPYGPNPYGPNPYGPQPCYNTNYNPNYNPQYDPNVSAPINAADGSTVLVENTNVTWINNRWRPVMGWVYMATCVSDFIIFPVLWSILQAIENGSVISQWKPVTLQGAGLYHIAMGTILGITAYGRTKEKLEGKQ